MNTQTNSGLNITNSYYFDRHLNLLSDQTSSTADYKLILATNNKIIFCSVSYNKKGVENCEEICITDRRMYSSDMLFNFMVFKNAFAQGSALSLHRLFASLAALLENNIPLTAAPHNI